MLLHYCFWSHITFSSASPGVLERKWKELQQTVILHLLPGCSTPLSKGMDGSQAQRRKSIHRALHTLISSPLPQHWSSSAAAWTGHNNFWEILVLRFCFKESHALSRALRGAVMSVHRNPQLGSWPSLETVWVRTESMEWLKVFGRNSLHLS